MISEIHQLAEGVTHRHIHFIIKLEISISNLLNHFPSGLSVNGY